MPRQVAPPPPAGEFVVRLSKPFVGVATHTVEVIGEQNRTAVVRVAQFTGGNKLSEKSGDVPKDDVQELLTLVNGLRGFPSHPSKDVYGLDARVEFSTSDIQWSNEDEDSTAGDVSEIAAEQKTELKNVADSIDALGRTFAKNDSAV